MAGLQFSSGIDKGFEKDLERMNRKMNSFSGNVDKQGSKINDTFRTIGATVGGIVTVGAFAAAGKEIVDFSNKLQTALVEVATISSEVSENQELYRDQLIALSTDQDLAASSATQLAEAYYDVVSAGYDGAEGIKVLEAAARAGTAGFVDAKVAGDGITTVLNAWGKSASEAGAVSDLFFKTVEKGKTTFPELGKSIAQVAPIAASMGVSFEEVSGAIATLTKSGTPTTQAMTQIRASLISMNKVLGDGWSETMTFQEGLNEVQKQAGGSQNELVKMLGTVEAVNAVLGLTGKNAEVAASDLEAMNDALGSTEAAAAKVVATTEHQIKLLKNNILAAFAPLGNEATSILAGLAQRLNEAFESGNVQKFAKVVLQLVKAFAVYKVATIAQNQLQKISILQNRIQAVTGSKVAKSTILAAKANKTLSRSFKSLSTAFKTNPIGLLVTAFTLVLPLITKFIDKQKELNKISNLSVNSIDKYNASLEVEKDNLNSLFDQLKKTNPETEERRRLIEELKKINPEYTSLIDLETASEGDLETARKNANDELERKIALQAKEVATTDINNQLVEQIENVRKLERELTLVDEKFAGRPDIIKANTEAYNSQIDTINKTIEALKAERDEISKYYDAILNPPEEVTPENLEAEEAARLQKLKDDAAKEAAKQDEKYRKEAIKALELANQQRINKITQQYGYEKGEQKIFLDELLQNQINYLLELRKLVSEPIELAKIDEQIIQARIVSEGGLDFEGIDNGVKKVDKSLKKYRKNFELTTDSSDALNTSWKDSLELINGVNELIGGLTESFDGLDETSKNIATGVTETIGGLLNMAQGIKAVGSAMTALEKASAILAVISTVLQVISAINTTIKKNEEIRVQAYVDQLNKIQAINVALIEQKRLYEEGNQLFIDDRWGTALAGLEAYNLALEYQAKLSRRVDLIQVRTNDVSSFAEYFGAVDSYENILKLYPELIKANGQYDNVILQTILDTADLKDEDRARLENLLEVNQLATDSYAQFGNYISSIFSSVGDDISQAFQTMYESGDNAMTALEGSFSDMIEAFTRDAIQFAFLQPYLNTLNETTTALGENYASGNITADELQTGIIDSLGIFYDSINEIQPAILDAYENADRLAAEAGFDSAFNTDETDLETTPDPIDETLSRAGQVSNAITEETGSMLVGRLGAMMLSNQEIANNTGDMVDYAVQNLVYMKAIKLNTDYLPEIAENTKKTFEKLENI